MAAEVALGQIRDLVLRDGRDHGRALPRIVRSVGEEDLVAVRMLATVELGDLLDALGRVHDVAKDGLALLLVVVQIHDRGPEAVLRWCNLEVGQLVALLPSPRAHVAPAGLVVLETCRVVEAAAAKIGAVVRVGKVGELLDQRELAVQRLGHVVAHDVLVAVLHGHGRRVGQHVEKVGVAQILRAEKRLDLGLVATADLAFKSCCGLAQRIGALYAGSLCDMLIKLVELVHGLHDARGRQGCHGRVWVRHAEPGRESARVGPAHSDPLVVWRWQRLLVRLLEVLEVGQRLLHSQVLVVLRREVAVRDAFAVEAVLQRQDLQPHERLDGGIRPKRGVCTLAPNFCASTCTNP